MKSVSTTELKRHLRAYLDMVRAGESVLVLDRGQPVATIKPVGTTDAIDPRMTKLGREGLVRPPTTDTPLDVVAFRELVPTTHAALLEAHVEERRKGR